jgi:hypothetical protein
MRLTAEHPDVGRAERLVRELEERVAAELAEAPITNGGGGVVVSPAERRASALRAERSQVERDIAAKERQVAAIEEIYNHAILEHSTNPLPRLDHES